MGKTSDEKGCCALSMLFRSSSALPVEGHVVAVDFHVERRNEPPRRRHLDGLGHVRSSVFGEDADRNLRDAGGHGNCMRESALIRPFDPQESSLFLLSFQSFFKKGLPADRKNKGRLLQAVIAEDLDDARDFGKSGGLGLGNFLRTRRRRRRLRRRRCHDGRGLHRGRRRRRRGRWRRCRRLGLAHHGLLLNHRRSRHRRSRHHRWCRLLRRRRRGWGWGLHGSRHRGRSRRRSLYRDLRRR